jgi:hypothetical protein
MLVQPFGGWNVFKQIFFDHWEPFKHALPRYQTAYDDSLVAKMLSLRQPRADGLRRTPLSAVWTGQAPGVDEL